MVATSQFDALFDSAGQQYDVDPRLTKTVFGIESNFNANSPDSYMGAQGGMQIMPDTARRLGIADPRNMEQAIPAATHYLRMGLDATGSPTGALAYYHGGEDRQNWGPKTAAYVAKGAALYPSITLAPQTTAADTTPTVTVSAKAPTKSQPAAAPADDPDTAAGLKLLEQSGKPAAPAPTGSQAPAAATPSDPDTAAGLKLLEQAGQPPPAAPATPGALPTEAIAPTTPATPEQATANAQSADAMTPQPGPARTTPTTAPGIQGNTPGSIWQAAKEGYDQTNLLTPQAQSYLDTNYPPLGTIVHDLNVPLGAFGAMGAAGLQAIAQGGNAVAPGLGNDLAVASQTIPELAASTGVFMPHGALGEALRAQRVDTAIANKAPLSPAFRDATQANPMPRTAPTADYSTNPNLIGDTAAAPKIPPLAAVGADVNRQPIPNYTQAERTTLERKTLYQQPSDRLVSGEDRTQYVPNTQLLPTSVAPTAADAAAEKTLIATEPVFREKIEAITKADNGAVLDHYDSVSGDANAVKQAVDERKAGFQTNMNNILAKASPVDAQPVVDAIDSALAGPLGRRAAVRDALRSARSELFTGDKLEADASLLDGARQNIQDLLSKTGQQTTPNLRLATDQLTDVKQSLVAQIEKSAPGYAQTVQDYADASKPIDAMKLLQDERGKLLDTGGAMQARKFQAMMARIVADRAAGGVNKAKSLSNDQMQQLFDIRNHLARDWYKDQQARVKGSDTTQQLSTLQKFARSPLGAVAGVGVDLTGNAAMQHFMPIVGPYLYQSLRKGYDARKVIQDAEQAMKAKQQLMDRLSTPVYPP